MANIKNSDKSFISEHENYTFCGIPICKIKRTDNTKFKNFLNIIQKEKSFNNYTEIQEIKIFGQQIYQRIEDLDAIKINILGISKTQNKQKAIIKQLKKLIPDDITKVFILKSNLGEAYLFLKYIINNFITDTDIPLIIATKPMHLQIAKMLVPNIQSLYCNKLNYEVNQKIFNIDEKTIYIAYPLKFYIDVENSAGNSDICYLNEMYRYYQISDEKKAKINRINISETSIKGIENYLIKNHIDKFIFISKYANTSENLSEKFWKKLESKIPIKIIYNNNKFKLEEVSYLAEKASAVISLRSGLSEILSETANSHIVIYTNFKKRYRFNEIKKENVLKMYSIKNLGVTNNNIYELLYSDEHENEIIENILNIIKAKEFTI